MNFTEEFQKRINRINNPLPIKVPKAIHPADSMFIITKNDIPIVFNLAYGEAVTFRNRLVLDATKYCREDRFEVVISQEKR
jgi:hypothetical protein